MKIQPIVIYILTTSNVKVQITPLSLSTCLFLYTTTLIWFLCHLFYLANAWSHCILVISWRHTVQESVPITSVWKAMSVCDIGTKQMVLYTVQLDGSISTNDRRQVEWVFFLRQQFLDCLSSALFYAIKLGSSETFLIMTPDSVVSCCSCYLYACNIWNWIYQLQSVRTSRRNNWNLWCRFNSQNILGHGKVIFDYNIFDCCTDGRGVCNSQRCCAPRDVI